MHAHIPDKYLKTRLFDSFLNIVLKILINKYGKRCDLEFSLKRFKIKKFELFSFFRSVFIKNIRNKI